MDTRSAYTTASSRPALSGREIEVLQAVITGETYRKIACMLGVQPGTIYAHMRNVRLKLGAASTPQAVAYAVANGILSV